MTNEWHSAEVKFYRYGMADTTTLGDAVGSKTVTKADVVLKVKAEGESAEGVADVIRDAACAYERSADLREQEADRAALEAFNSAPAEPDDCPCGGACCEDDPAPSEPCCEPAPMVSPLDGVGSWAHLKRRADLHTKGGRPT